ncbi:MAG TPA: amino acid permease [Gemmatimonadales bacterium]|nr:amino acid permease [Gemmatimonadales bacterium]
MTAPAATASALRRVIGVFGLAAAIFNITIGAAIFVLPAHMAAALGAAAPLAYGICVVAMALIALCMAEAGSRVAQSGGPYAYVQAAFGPFLGYLCGVLLWLGLTFAMAAVATVLADALATLIPALSGTAPRALILGATFTVLAIVNVRGAAWGSGLSGISTLAKLLPLVAFVVLGLPHVNAANLTIAALPPVAEIGRAGLLLMFAFFGMEAALQVSGEVINPSRVVPRAIALALLGVGFLYVSVQLVAQGVLGATLAAPETAKAPLAAAAAQFAGTAGARLILIGMIVSTFGFMTAMMLSTPRTLFALASDGYLPRPLAAVHPVHSTPHVAILVQGVIVFLIALTGTYVKLALMANVVILLVYLACCLGVWRLRRRNVVAAPEAHEATTFRMPGGAVVPWLAAALIVALLVPATADEWKLTGAVVAIASLGFLRRRR